MLSSWCSLVSTSERASCFRVRPEDVILHVASAGPRYRTVAEQLAPAERGKRTKAGVTDDTVTVDQQSPAALMLLDMPSIRRNTSLISTSPPTFRHNLVGALVP